MISFHCLIHHIIERKQVNLKKNAEKTHNLSHLHSLFHINTNTYFTKVKLPTVKTTKLSDLLFAAYQKNFYLDKWLQVAYSAYLHL